MVFLLFLLLLVLLFIWWKNRIGEIEPPVQRKYIPVQPKESGGDLERIKVCSYNLFADAVAFRFMTTTPYKYLNFRYRSVRIVQEIANYRSDILCLQEVDHFRDFYKPELEKLGYSCVYNLRKKKCCRHGAAVGFLKESFSLLELGNVDFNDIDPDDSFYKTNSAALICLLQSKHSGRMVIVSSLHTWFRNKAIVCGQVAFLLYKIENFVAKYKNKYPGISIQTTPIFIGGDFNATPEKEAIRYMQNLSPILDPSVESQKIKHIWLRYPNNFKMRSAYENYKLFRPNENERLANSSNQHPDYTFVKSFLLKTHKACLDYIWYNPSAIEVLEVLEIPKEETIRRKGEIGLPNSLFSSDHLRVEAVFGIKKIPNEI